MTDPVEEPGATEFPESDDPAPEAPASPPAHPTGERQAASNRDEDPPA